MIVLLNTLSCAKKIFYLFLWFLAFFSRTLCSIQCRGASKMSLTLRDAHNTPSLLPVGLWPVIPAHRTGRVFGQEPRAIHNAEK